MGATGFTGELVSEYLVRHHLGRHRSLGPPLRIALAGRSKDKLARVRDRLAAVDPQAGSLPVIVADSHDGPALEALAARTEVVCSTVGPYAQHGEALVAACVTHGTDYCDLTGEPQFIRRNVDAHHAEARRTGARIVHSCGFDSIPSDLGTLMLQEHAIAEAGGPCASVKFAIVGGSGAFSGGTIASMLNLIEEASESRATRKILGHPYGLNPEGERSGPDGSDLKSAKYDEDLDAWIAPFVMAAINTRVVRRSNALSGYAYGRDFRYAEMMVTGKGLAGAVRAGALTAGMGGFLALASVGLSRRLLARTVLPKPGEGPDRAKREAGYFVARLVGLAPGGDQKRRLEARVKGEQDPGYGETAKMLGESAVCLALDGAQLEAGGGILTPASCMGMTLVARLRDAGMTFEIREG